MPRARRAAYELELEYSPGPDDVLRPYLWLVLVGPNGSEVLLQGLIDSGADYSCVPLEYAARLGYAPAEGSFGEGTQLRGTIDFWRARDPLHAYLPGDRTMTFELYPHFVDGAEVTLWGRLDFMGTWEVVISQPRQTFTMKH